MDDLVAEFVAETREMLASLAGEIVAWEAEPQDRARLDAIFRFVHTVKGNSGFFDLPRLTALSHAAEDALAEVREGRRAPDAALVSAVLAAVDSISRHVETLDGGPVADGDDAALIAALAGRGTVAPPAPAPAAAAAQTAAARSIRLPLSLLDRMMNGISDLVLARNELARRLRERDAGPDAEEAFRRLSATVAEVRQAVTRTRMQRIESLFAALPRLVRDLAAETGKEVALETDGQGVELDREMIEIIRDPLTHLVRNAIDHGIEPAAVRAAAGKPARGTLRVQARQSGNQILIEVADDGRGIDGAALAARAVAGGRLSREEAERLPHLQRIGLIFEPGLSTAAEVTAISGRGVGMDVVRANVERIGGTVEVDSRAGRGTAFTLRVPLTLTIIPGLAVECGGQVFAIPRSAVDEIVRVRADGVRLDRMAGAAVATVRGRRLPVLPLDDALGLAPSTALDDRILLLVRGPSGAVFALAVDRVDDHEELVVKPGGPAVMATGLYAGTTLGEDGRPILLLDTVGLAARAGSAAREEEGGDAAAAPAAEGRRALLFRTIDGRLRAVPLAAVARIDELPSSAVGVTAGRCHVAVDGRLLPLAGCAQPPETARFCLLRLGDGQREIGYAAGQVHDIVALPDDACAAAAACEVQGVALIGGEQVETLDLHWLFAHHGAVEAAAGGAEARPLCPIPAGDPWMDMILRPMVEGAGYRVVTDRIPGAAPPELVIVAGDAAPAAAGDGARVLRLRADRDGPEGSVHRYDRDALVAALGLG